MWPRPTDADASGVLFAHGSRFGGHSLFIKDKKLYYVYNFLGIKPEQVFMSNALSPAKFTLSGDGMCIGWDSDDAVSDLYKSPGRFDGGTIQAVGVDTGKESYEDLSLEAKRQLMKQ
jgi:hypothetical protein